MIFLRVFLYILCIVSVSWSLLVFTGPVLMKKLITMYTSGAVLPSGIEITPTLDVNIGRLDFRFDTDHQEVPISGLIRSTKISWSISSEKPFLTINLGPTFFQDVGAIKNLKIHTPSLAEISWQVVPLVMNSSNLEYGGKVNVGSINIEGNLNPRTLKLKDIQFDTNLVSVRSDNFPWSIGKISGFFSDLDLDIPYYEQPLSIEFSANRIIVSQPQLSITKARGIVDLSNSQDFDINLHDIHFSDFDGTVEKIKLHGVYDRHSLFETLKVELRNGIFGKYLPPFSTLSSKLLKLKDETYTASISGRSDGFEIYNSKALLGFLPPSNFLIHLNLDTAESLVKGNSKISFDSGDALEISPIFEAGLELLQFQNLADCSVVKCNVSNFKFIYKMNVEDDWIKGKSVCLANLCNFGGLTHKIQTSNTVNIFTNLNKSGMLTPISTVYLYGVMSAGKKINMGHELVF